MEMGQGQEAEVARTEELLSSFMEGEEQESQEREEDPNCVRRFVAIIWLLGAFLILWHGGSLVWGALCLALFPVPCLWPNEIFAQTEPQAVNQTEAERGTQKEDVVAVFGNYEGVSSCWKFFKNLGRVAKFMVLVARFALNVTFIMASQSTSNSHSLPNHTAELANLAKHWVVALEYPLAILFLCSFFMHAQAALTGSVEALPALVDTLRMGGRYSVLSVFQMPSPVNAIEEVLAAKTKGRGFALAVGLMHCVRVPVAVMAVLAKLYQVAFATEKVIGHWTLFEYLAFAGFINNLAGFMGDIASGKKQAIMASRAEDPQQLLKVWEQNLATKLQEVYGTSLGLVMFATVSVEDFCQLLNPNLRPEFLYSVAARAVASGHP
eukprot:Skav202930  [mRNA]  locus=scaffold1565:356126:357265:- [translate_table: standard]